MKTVTLIMKRASLAQGLMDRLEADGELELHYQADYAAAAETLRRQGTQVLLLEAAELGPYNTGDCLTLCGTLRESNPDCRVMLMCPEQDRQAVEQVIRAKRTGLIDDFVFYDVSMEYLLTALKAL